jgi:hypothetical protein
MSKERSDTRPPDPDLDPLEQTTRPMSWLQEGLAISQRVMVVALSFGLPVLAGAGIDLGWPIVPKIPIGMLTGFIFGMLASGWQLWRLTQWLSKKNLVRAATKDNRRDQAS